MTRLRLLSGSSASNSMNRESTEGASSKIIMTGINSSSTLSAMALSNSWSILAACAATEPSEMAIRSIIDRAIRRCMKVS